MAKNWLVLKGLQFTKVQNIVMFGLDKQNHLYLLMRPNVEYSDTPYLFDITSWVQMTLIKEQSLWGQGHTSGVTTA